MIFTAWTSRIRCRFLAQGVYCLGRVALRPCWKFDRLLLEIKRCFAAKAEESKLAGTMWGDQGLLRECRWNCDVIYYGLLGSFETWWNLFLPFLPEHQVWLRRQVPMCWVISMLHLDCNVGAQAMTFRNEIASQVMHWIIHRSGLRIL